MASDKPEPPKYTNAEVAIRAMIKVLGAPDDKERDSYRLTTREAYDIGHTESAYEPVNESNCNVFRMEIRTSPERLENMSEWDSIFLSAVKAVRIMSGGQPEVKMGVLFPVKADPLTTEDVINEIAKKLDKADLRLLKRDSAEAEEFASQPPTAGNKEIARDIIREIRMSLDLGLQ